MVEHFPIPNSVCKSLIKYVNLGNKAQGRLELKLHSNEERMNNKDEGRGQHIRYMQINYEIYITKIFTHKLRNIHINYVIYT